MKRLRVVLADDHALVRSGISALLDPLDGVEVVGEAADGAAAVALVAALSPDVVLMDITMPTMNGLVATQRLARDFPNVRVLILSVHADEEFVREALRAGAAGYLLKDASTDELQLALQAVSAGDLYLSSRVSKSIIADVLGARQRGGGAGRLTLRQREVLQLIGEGYSTRAIADRLGLSPKTVETHRAHLMKRLGVSDVAGLVRHAIRLGLVSAEQ
ncbi:MAG TPA: response regulator transcription factor [Gemmatimonadales bacterium]